MSVLVLAISSNSCIRRCKECWYLGDDPRVGFIYQDTLIERPLGKVCGDDLDRLLSDGYTIGDSTYVVHCD
jgi:hypothetical protein